MAEAVKLLLDKHPDEKGIIHCVEENTLVTLGDRSLKKISDIVVGEEILTWNESLHSFEKKIVDDVWVTGVRECIEIELENGQKVVCTPEHRILTHNRGWVEAQDLNENDEIVSHNV
jgi:ribonucleoside-diphosphate reductase alpha chain